jgi:copper(I)-binding protein
MRKTSRLILVTPILAASMGPAFAHAYLQSAVPAVDSTVTQTPNEITIAFTGAIEPRFSTIEVTGPDAQRVDDARPHLAEGDATRLSVGLRSLPPGHGLPPGTYTVAWHATSVDTHQTDGGYRFTVAATDASGISLEHVWARATVGLSTTGAAYFTVSNNGQPDHLVGVSTPIAVAGLHETINDNGIMKMRPVPSIALDPGKPVTFKPGGYHVMLTGLKSVLKPGDSFPLTLSFEHAQPVTVTVNVEAAGGAAMDNGHGGMGSMPGMQGH